MTQNARLRDEIDNLRVERFRFEELHKKLEKEHQNLRQSIAEVIENSTQAYDQRWIFTFYAFLYKMISKIF